jgi:hypothetical protein
MHRPKRHSPITRPPFHHFQERARVSAAVIGELLHGRIMLRIQAFHTGLLENLDGFLQKLPHLMRPGGTLLLVQRGKAAESGFHGCK